MSAPAPVIIAATAKHTATVINNKLMFVYFTITIFFV